MLTAQLYLLLGYANWLRDTGLNIDQGRTTSTASASSLPRTWKRRVPDLIRVLDACGACLSFFVYCFVGFVYPLLGVFKPISKGKPGLFLMDHGSCGIVAFLPAKANHALSLGFLFWLRFEHGGMGPSTSHFEGSGSPRRQTVRPASAFLPLAECARMCSFRLDPDKNSLGVIETIGFLNLFVSHWALFRCS